jgi:mitochondrial import inner membrane translocase subunit TIM10
MSMFGFGRPQPSSAEKIAAAEQEMDLVTDMFNKYASIPISSCSPEKATQTYLIIFSN